MNFLPDFLIFKKFLTPFASPRAEGELAWLC